MRVQRNVSRVSCPEHSVQRIVSAGDVCSFAKEVLFSFGDDVGSVAKSISMFGRLGSRGGGLGRGLKRPGVSRGGSRRGGSSRGGWGGLQGVVSFAIIVYFFMVAH